MGSSFNSLPFESQPLRAGNWPKRTSVVMSSSDEFCETNRPPAMRKMRQAICSRKQVAYGFWALQMKYDIYECIRMHAQLRDVLLDLQCELDIYKLKHQNVEDSQSRKYEAIILHYQNKDVPMRSGIAYRRAIMDESVNEESRQLAIAYVKMEPSDLWQLTHPA